MLNRMVLDARRAGHLARCSMLLDDTNRGRILREISILNNPRQPSACNSVVDEPTLPAEPQPLEKYGRDVLARQHRYMRLLRDVGQDTARCRPVEVKRSVLSRRQQTVREVYEPSRRKSKQDQFRSLIDDLAAGFGGYPGLSRAFASISTDGGGAQCVGTSCGLLGRGFKPQRGSREEGSRLGIELGEVR